MSTACYLIKDLEIHLQNNRFSCFAQIKSREHKEAQSRNTYIANLMATIKTIVLDLW